MKFLDLFAGIGGFRLGMEHAGHECVGYVEIDKYARRSYEAIHDTEGEWTAHDIKKVTDEEWRKFRGTVDVICGGFPCQAFSIAGKRLGFEETRGTLFFEIARAAKQIQPRVLFLENVKGLLSHNDGETFATILTTLDELGYDAEWRVLTAKIMESHKTENACSLWQILESPDQVPESFYLSDEKTAQLIAKADFSKNQIGNLLETDSFGGNPQIGRVYNVEGTSPALNTMTGGGRVPKIAIPVLTPGREEKRQDGRRFKDVGEEMFTLTAQDIHGVLIPIREATKRGYALAKAFDSVNLAMPNSKTRRGRVGDQIANTLDTSCNQGVVVPVGNINPSGKGMNGNVYSDEGISPTLTTNKGEGVKVLQVGRGFNKGGVKSISPALTKNSWQENNFLIDNIIWRIRKVMPIECFRLQSFPDWVFKAAEKVNSNSQLYKQAGNSVTVNIIEKIARLFKEETK